MTKLIKNIFEGDFKNANRVFSEQIQNITERKLEEAKKRVAAEDLHSNPPWLKSTAKTDKKLAKPIPPIKAQTKVVKNVEEAVVQKDGLVHLASGEKVLPSVHNLRRGLMEDENTKPEPSATNDAYGTVKGTEAISAAKKAVLAAMLMKSNRESLETDDEAKVTSCKRELEKK